MCIRIQFRLKYYIGKLLIVFFLHCIHHCVNFATDLFLSFLSEQTLCPQRSRWSCSGSSGRQWGTASASQSPSRLTSSRQEMHIRWTCSTNTPAVLH